MAQAGACKHQRGIFFEEGSCYGCAYHMVHSMMLLVWIRVQCSVGEDAVGQSNLSDMGLRLLFKCVAAQFHSIGYR